MRKQKQSLDDMFLVTPPAPKEKPVNRRKMVSIGRDLHILTDDDIAFILNPANSDAAIRSRYHTAIQR
jgi:hypothetical protein